MALAIRLTAPLLIAWCVLSALWVRLFFVRGFAWIKDVQGLPGWVALLSWACLGIVAVLLRVVVALGLPLMRPARVGGVVLLVLSPVIVFLGKKCSRVQASNKNDLKP